MEGRFSNPLFNRGQECPRSKRRKKAVAKNNLQPLTEEKWP
jgi:hypothetical protein